MKRTLIIFIISIVSSITTYKAYSQCACCAGASAGSSNNLCNNGILTLSKNQWLMESYGDFRTIKEGADIMKVVLILPLLLKKKHPSKAF